MPTLRASEYGVCFGKRRSLAWAKVPPFSAWFFRIFWQVAYFGHSGDSAVWPSCLQFGQKGVLLQLSP